MGIFNINFHNSNTDKALRQAIAYAINRPEIIETGARRPGDAQLHDPARVQGLRRHQQVRVRPGQGARQLLAESSWDINKTFRLALLAEDPNFTVTAPALQQYLEALGLKVELTALPTAPYTDLIQKTDDFEAFLSFGGSEGVGWYQSSIYYDCAGLGQAPAQDVAATSASTPTSSRPPRP